MKQKQVERRSLLVGIGANAVMGAAGMIVFMITGMEAVFLDGAFTLIALASGVVAVFISSHSIRTTDNYPNGFFALEPMYAICKALMTISLLAFSLLNVIQGWTTSSSTSRCRPRWDRWCGTSWRWWSLG